MAKILIIYGTNEGHTRKVAEHMADAIRAKGHQAELLQGIKAPPDFSLAGYDGVIAGTSIHMGAHQIAMRKLVKKHHEEFQRLPGAYFCVCLTATSTRPEYQQQVEKYISDFIKYTHWQPQRAVAFAGAIRYPYYNIVKRFMIKLVARKLGLDTDTKREFIYTDWAAVARFAEEFVGEVGGTKLG